MSLPNPSMSFTPFDILTAEEMNNLVENIEALAAGTGLDNSAVTTAKINDNAVTSSKISGIDKSLTTTDSNPYKFRARRTIALSTSAGVPVKVACDTEDFDTNSNFASGTYTAPVAGFYFFNTYGNVAGGTNIITLYKNGSAYQRGTQAGSGGTGSPFFVQSAANDTWEFYFTGTSTAAFDVTAGIQPFFEGFLMCRS